MIDRYNLYFMASSSNVLLPLPFSVDGRMDAALIVMVGNKIACAMIPLRLDINRGVSMTQAQATYDERAQIFLQILISLRNTTIKILIVTNGRKTKNFVRSCIEVGSMVDVQDIFILRERQLVERRYSTTERTSTTLTLQIRKHQISFMSDHFHCW